MLLFSRITTPSGSPRRVIPWVMDITAYVNANTDLTVTCWAGTYGYPIGTVAWSSIVESQASFVAASTALNAQDGYLDRLEAAADMVTTPGEDRLGEIIHGAPSDPPPLGAIGRITRATAVVDRMAEAVGWSIGIAQYVEQVIDSPVAVLSDLYGAMGGITWIGVVPDAAAADASRAKLAGDSGYLERLHASKGLFVNGSGHVSEVTRIA